MPLRFSGVVGVLLASTLCLALSAAAQVVEQPLEIRHVLPDEAAPSDPPYQVAQSVAATLPPGFFTEQIAPGNSFSSPVAVTFAPDGRLFVVEKRGRVYVVDNGTKLTTPFLNIESEVLNHWDRGLLGFELDPDFENNGYVYALYTYDRDGSGDYARVDVASRLTRFTVDSQNPDVVDPGSRTVLIGEDFPSAIPSCYYSHAIGTLQFGSDGSLMVGAGDGASFNVVDPGGLHPDCFGVGRFPASEDIGAFRSQYLESLAGKILRVDPATGEGLPSNPYYTGDPDDNQSRVWVSGLRNPFRFFMRKDGSSDPADGEPGTLFVGDVGWNTWEDVEVAHEGGENFGWPCYEGFNQHSGYQDADPAHSDCDGLSSQDAPVYSFRHGDNNGGQSTPPGLPANAIVVGDIYTGYRYPAEYIDRIFYADYSRGWISSSSVSAANALSDFDQFASGAGAVVDIRFDEVSSYLYFVDVSGGQVYRIRHNDENAPPNAVASATPTDGYAPLLVQFTGSDSSDPDDDDLSFDWDFGDGGSSTDADPQHLYTLAGTHQVSLTVTDGRGGEDQSFVQIAVDNTYPTAIIVEPSNGGSVMIGETVNLVGTGTDAEDAPGDLTYEWGVSQQHNTHVHPEFFVATDSIASFVAEEHGLGHEVSFVRVELIVSDTGGLRDTSAYVIEVRRRAEFDITDAGTPVALVTNPTGSGNPDLAVIADEVYPPIGTTDPSLHYDTYDGSAKSEDWIGYTFASDRYFSKLLLQQGVQTNDGGWFDDINVEVRVDDVWTEVQFASFLRPYEGNNGINFDRYTIVFEGIRGDGIRLTGEPGGSLDYLSIGELRVFELAVVEFAATPDGGTSPLEVQFTDQSTVPDAWTWTWEFGDGYTSNAQNPLHTYTEPGAYDVTLSITSAAGEFAATEASRVVVGENGLLGQYFDDPEFTGTRLVRVDQGLDFEWGNGSPDASMGVDNFSIRWTGWVQPEFTEQYTFHTITDDGVRLWINGELIIDQWIPQAPTEWTGTIQLEAGRYYAVRMEFYEQGGGAVAHLDWSSPSRPRQMIPASRLRVGSLGPRVAAFDPSIGGYAATVHIYGENLALTTSVGFNGHEAEAFGIVSEGHIWAQVPGTAVSGPITVTTSEGVASSIGEFLVDDGTLSVELADFRAVLAEGGVRLMWRTTGSSSAARFLVEHSGPVGPDFVEIDLVEASNAGDEYRLETHLAEPGRHRFRLGVVGVAGAISYSPVVEVDIDVAGNVVVEPPYPNPFSDSATLRFTVARTQTVDVSVYDMIGRRVMVLYSGEAVANTPVTVRLERTPVMSSGLYLIRFEGEDFATDRKLMRVGGGD